MLPNRGIGGASIGEGLLLERIRYAKNIISEVMAFLQLIQIILKKWKDLLLNAKKQKTDTFRILKTHPLLLETYVCGASLCLQKCSVP